MLYSLCSGICDRFVKENIIQAEHKELYVYGLQQFFVTAFNILITLLIGFVLGMFWQSLLYLVAYMPVRIYAGGFHAKTPRRCFFFSVILVIVALSVMKFVVWTPFICAIGMALSGVAVFLLAPVEDQNKPFTAKEEIVFKKRTRLLLCAELILFAVALFLDWQMVCLCLFIAMATLAIMLILGKVKNYCLINKISVLR